MKARKCVRTSAPEGVTHLASHRSSGKYRAIVVVAMICAGLVLIAVPAIAAKGGNGNGNGGGGGSQSQESYSLALNESDPHLGGTVTFSATFPKSAKNPRIQVMCYQGGVLVYGEAEGYDAAFLLGGASSDWLRNGGPASCVADAFDLSWNGNNMQEVTWYGELTFEAAG
jgi:hypothetical protein